MKRKMMNQDEWLMRALLLRIEGGEFRPGGRLPAERALAEEYGLQRMVARAALERLAERGTVLVRPREGYYVAPRRLCVHLPHGMDMLRDFLCGQLTWGEPRIEATEVTDPLARRTLLPLGSAAWRMERRGYADGAVVAQETWFLAGTGDAASLPPCPWARATPQGEKPRTAGVLWSRCEMDVAFAHAALAGSLSLEEHAPLYRFRIYGYTDAGSVGCFRELYLPASRFAFESDTGMP